jgi:hypothetical protein
VSRISYQITPTARPARTRTALSGTFLTEPPLHLAAGSHWLDLDEETEVRCTCDWGCHDCQPEDTKEWKR